MQSSKGEAMSTEDAICQELITDLSNAGLTVAVAESLTGGLLCAAFVQVPGASNAVRGGVCTYATDTKHSVLKVSDQRLAQTGPVDDEVARQMAQGVRTLMGADFGLSTTGVAGPGPADGHPAGTVYVGCAWEGCSRVQRLDLSGDRDQVRQGAVIAALELFREVLKATPNIHTR